MTAISRRTPPVAIEYDRNGQRVRREFACQFKARRFYTAEHKAGRNPRVVKGAGA